MYRILKRALAGRADERNQKGFTLLELMIVVVILSLASVFIYPGFRREIENREAKQMFETLKNISHAARSYKINNNGAYPTSLGALETGGYVVNSDYFMVRKSDGTKLIVYSFAPSGSSFLATAQRKNTSGANVRLISLRLCSTNPSEFQVTDDAGYLDTGAGCTA